MDHLAGPPGSNGSTLQSADPEALQLDESTSDEKTAENPDGLQTGLEKVLSRIASRTSCPDPGPPPDGGLQAWTQSLMGHLVVFNTWGYIISFGVFQPYYVTTLNRPPSDISWIGSVQIFLLFFIGTVSGRSSDAGLFRPTFVLGTVFLLVGVFMTSLSTTYVIYFYLPFPPDAHLPSRTRVFDSGGFQTIISLPSSRRPGAPPLGTDQQRV